MGATLQSKTWLFTILVLLGALLGACTNQSGSSGPSHPTGQTGHADTSADIRVQVAVNPNTIDFERRAGITVLVTNRIGGRPLEGRHVQLSTTVGTLDVVDGFTDADGKFVSFLLCTAAGSAAITAFVEGASGTATVTCGGPPTTPAPTTTPTPTPAPTPTPTP